MKWLGVTVLCLGLALLAQAPRTSRRAGDPPKPQNATGLTASNTQRVAHLPQPAAPVPETARPPIQEIFPTSFGPGSAELKLFQDSAARQRDVRKVLAEMSSRRLNSRQRETISRIRSFLQLSDDAEAKKDLWTADVLAKRAQGMVGELQSEGSGRSALLPNMWR